MKTADEMTDEEFTAAVEEWTSPAAREIEALRAENAKSEPTARLFAQVGSTDGLCGNGSEVGAGGAAVDIAQAPDIHAELTMAAFHREVGK